MSSELEPLDHEVRALLDDVDRVDAKADDAIMSRMRERIDLALAGAAAEVPMRSALGSPSVTPPARTLRRVLSSTGTFAAGAVVALAAQRLLAPSSPPPTVAPVSTPALVAAPTGTPVSLPTSTMPEPSPPAPTSSGQTGRFSRSGSATSARTPPRALPAPPLTDETRDEALAAESRLVDTARSALAHGDFVAALVAVTNHERRFPSGQLAEEREALQIQALAGAHQDSEARTRAEAFRARYPESFFLPLVNRALMSTSVRER
jgi:hypothetical protein